MDGTKPAFIQFLIDKKYCYRDEKNTVLPYDQYVKDGIFVVRISQIERGEFTFDAQSTKATGVGLQYLREQIVNGLNLLQAPTGRRKVLPAPGGNQ